jgi:hypothetical protein
VAVGEVLVGELADETDVLLHLLAFPLHLLDAILAALVLQTLQDVLVLPNDLQQLPLAVRLVQRLLLPLAQILIETGVGGLAS